MSLALRLRTPSVILAASFLAFAAAPPAAAQTPKIGDWYEDAVDLGFKVRMPEDWAFIPPQPGEQNLIGKYTPETNKSVYLGGKNLPLTAFLLRFDRTPTEAEEELEIDGEPTPEQIREMRRRAMRQSGHRDVQAWLTSTLRFDSTPEESSRKKAKVDKTPATEIVFEADWGSDVVKIYTMVYHLTEDLDVAALFYGPGDRKKWRKWESPFKRMAKSFQRVEVETVDTSSVEGESPARARRKMILLKEIEKNPSWELYETPNYFIVSNNDDREFLRELQQRLEAIREVYEEQYPPGSAQVMRQDKEAEEDEGEGDPRPGEPRTSAAAGFDPQDLSRASVVRVCASRAEYNSYGGPPGSAGYWSSHHEELVLYDDKGGGGRRNTWAVLNHEAFHQYIFYFYGNLAPHSWYNEGTGDYFSGFEYKHGRFTEKPFDWRTGVIQEAIRSGKNVPLKDLVRFTQQEYYGQNKYGVGGGQNYAQGWSLIWFLRTGKKKARGWNDDWDSILDTYLKTLAETGDLTQAVGQAFAGVDWDELEAAWKNYIE